MFTTIISTAQLAENLDNDNFAIIDCRFRLDDVDAGRTAYLESHIPGAVYAHLDHDLSGPVGDGSGGRHPLPAPDDFAKTLSEWGISNDTQVVAYDDISGVYAGRLWWMLRWLGHDAVAVLDGDWRTWQKEERPTASGAESPTAATFTPQVRDDMQVSVDDVLANIESGARKMFDVRDEKRYRGEAKGMDPAAGHIPGARSAFFGPNIGEDGKFLPAEQLRARFEGLLDGSDPEQTIFYCGSGVSVHHDLLAMEIAGLASGHDDNARVYIGSWSGWSSDPNRPVETGG